MSTTDVYSEEEYNDLFIKVNAYRVREHDLYRQENKREITLKELSKALDPLESEITIINKRLVELMSAKMHVKQKQVQKTLDDVEVQRKEIRKEKMKDIKVGRKQDPNSYLSLTIEGLCDSKLNTVEKIAAFVNKKRPGRETEKIIEQIKRTVYRVKRQEPGPYQEYTWDEKKFILVKK